MNVLERRNFWLYAMGRLVSVIGSGIQMIAIPLYILDLTGSGTMMGIFTFLSLLPALLMSPFAGVLGDRWNRKKIMVNMDFARGALILFLAFMAITNNMNIYILFIAQVFISFMDSLFNATTSAMVPELVSGDDLRKANSHLGSINSSAQIVGPILGGIVYGFGGIKFVFLLNGISFVLSAISELYIKYKSITKSKEKISVKIFVTDFKEGFEFIKSNRNLLIVLFYACSANLLLGPAISIALPYALKKVIGFTAKEYGVISAMATTGILLGNIILATLLAKKSSKKLIKLGLFGVAVFNIIFAVTIFPNSVAYFGGASLTLFAIISSIFIILGIFNAFVNTPLFTNLQKLVPNKLRSRVFSVIGIFLNIGIPLGAVVCGILLDLVVVHVLYTTISILLVIVTFIFLLLAPAEAYNPKKTNIEAS